MVRYSPIKRHCQWTLSLVFKDGKDKRMAEYTARLEQEGMCARVFTDAKLFGIVGVESRKYTCSAVRPPTDSQTIGIVEIRIACAEQQG